MNFNFQKPVRSSVEKKTEHPVIKKIASLLHQKKIKKRECVLKAGEVNTNIIYVKSGMLRAYLIYEGKEVNTWFINENDFFLSMNSYYYDIPSHESVEALENSEIITISKVTYETLLKVNHKLSLFAVNELYIKLCEYQDQCLLLRFMSAERKYAFLRENKPEIVEKVSQKHLASFLGIETTYLSKIIANYKKEK